MSRVPTKLLRARKLTSGIPLVQAAKALKCSPETIRGWIRRGAPVVQLGEVGRGKTSLVDVRALKRWKAGDLASLDYEERLQFLTEVLWDTFKRDDAAGRVGITDGQAAGVLALVFERYWKNLMRRPVDELQLPPQISNFLTIFIESPESK